MRRMLAIDQYGTSVKEQIYGGEIIREDDETSHLKLAIGILNPYKILNKRIAYSADHFIDYIDARMALGKSKKWENESNWVSPMFFNYYKGIQGSYRRHETQKDSYMVFDMDVAVSQNALKIENFKLNTRECTDPSYCCHDQFNNEQSKPKPRKIYQTLSDISDRLYVNDGLTRHVFGNGKSLETHAHFIPAAMSKILGDQVVAKAQENNMSIIYNNSNSLFDYFNVNRKGYINCTAAMRNPAALYNQLNIIHCFEHNGKALFGADCTVKITNYLNDLYMKDSKETAIDMLINDVSGKFSVKRFDNRLVNG